MVKDTMAYTDKGATMYNNEEGMSRAALLHRPGGADLLTDSNATLMEIF